MTECLHMRTYRNLETVTGQRNPEMSFEKHSLMARSQMMTSPKRLLTLMSQSMGMGKLPTPSVWPRLGTTWSLIQNSMETAFGQL